VEVPLLNNGDFLIATIQAALTDEIFFNFVRRCSASGTLPLAGRHCDVTSLDVMDSLHRVPFVRSPR